MNDSNLLKLYSSRIFELTASIPHLGRLKAPQASATKRSPLCGSQITVDVIMSNGRVAEFAQEIQACILGQAAAAVVGKAIIGLTPETIEEVRHEMREMLLENGPVPRTPFDAFEVMISAKEYKNRHASIMLAIEATTEAVKKASQHG